MKWWLTLYLLAQGLDLATTAYQLRQRGCREVVWPHASMMYAGKSAGIVVTVALTRAHPTAAKVISGIGIASGTAGTLQNLRQDCR